MQITSELLDSQDIKAISEELAKDVIFQQEIVSSKLIQELIPEFHNKMFYTSSKNVLLTAFCLGLMVGGRICESQRTET